MVTKDTLDGKPATSTTFATKTNSSKTVDLQPVVIDPNTKYKKPVTVAHATGDMTGAQQATVTYVSDGDTAGIKTKSGQDLVCRLKSSDAPEVEHKNMPAQPYGKEAGAMLRRMIDKKEISVIVTKAADTSGTKSKENNWGRAVCDISIKGKNVDAEMIKAGASWLYRTYGEVPDDKLVQMESTARANHKGLWAGNTTEDKVRPSIHRRKYRKGTDTPE